MEIFARLLLLFCRTVGFLLTPFVKLFYKRHQRLAANNNHKICFANETMKEVKPSVKQNLVLVAASDLVIDIKNKKVQKIYRVKIILYATLLL